MKGPQEIQQEEKNKPEEAIEQPETPKDPDFSIDPPVIEELDLDAVAKSFNLEDQDDRIHHLNRLRRIVDWARRSGATDREGIVSKVMAAKKHMGGLNIYDMSVYAGLQLDKISIEEKIKGFEE